MKKIVSLLLTVIMVLGTVSFTALASTDTLLTGTLEVGLTADTYLAVTPNGGTGDSSSDGFAGSVGNADAEFKSSNGVKVINQSGNNVFELSADTTGINYEHKLELFLGSKKSDKIKRYSAKVMLPSVSEGRTSVFQLITTTSAVSPSKSQTTSGVVFKGGKAYYYDRTVNGGEEVSFLDEGKTIEANRWYTIEALMDCRLISTDPNTSVVYMNAFVYDDTGACIGKTGYKNVAAASLKSGWGWASPLGAAVSASGYSEGSKVYVDDFKAYKVDGVPSYTIRDASGSATNNKYISAKTASAWYRTVAERFNNSLNTQTANNNNITSTSIYKAAHYEMSFRLPSLSTTSTYNLIGFSTGANGVMSNTTTNKGFAFVNANGLFQAQNVEGSAVTLTEGTTYQLDENIWYNITVDVDYSTFATPKAKLYLKDASGNVLTQSAEYTVAQMPVDSNTQTVVIWNTFSNTSGQIHIDNTKAYVAETMSNLTSGTDVKTVIDEDFEVYNGDNASYYDVGDAYGEIAGKLHVQVTNPAAVNYQCQTTVVAIEEIVSGSFNFEDGMTLPNTKAIGLKFTFDNPIPAANANTTNIKLLVGDTPLVGGVDYTVTPGTADADGNVTDFVVAIDTMQELTTYTLRVMADATADYNATAASKAGVPAAAGLYTDYTFSTPERVPDVAVTSIVADADGNAVASLDNGAVVKGKATITNNAMDDDVKAYAIIAIYDGTELVSAKISEEPVTVSKGETKPVETETITLTKAGLTAKVFVWNGLSLMKPYAVPTIFPVPAQ